jgi:hypothetical protein
VLGFQDSKLGNQAIKLIIADDGVIQGMVAVIVEVDLVPKVFDVLDKCWIGHIAPIYGVRKYNR